MSKEIIYLIVEDEVSEIKVGFSSKRAAERQIAELAATGFQAWIQEITIYDPPYFPASLEYWEFSSYIAHDTRLVKRTDQRKLYHWSYEDPIEFGTVSNTQNTLTTTAEKWDDARIEHEDELRLRGAILL